jgi:hypothetical protein
MRIKWLNLLLLAVLALPIQALAQDLVLPDYFATGDTLSQQILRDTSSAEFKAGTRVYVLHMDGIYIWTQSITLPAGAVVKFRAAYEAGQYNPAIYLYPGGAGGTIPGQTAQLAANCTWQMTRINWAGYPEFIADTAVNKFRGSNTMFLRTLSSGSNTTIILDSCIVKTIAGQIIRTEGAAHLIQITNSIFADMGHPTSNFGAGKFIDARAVKVDSMIIRNCTFVNLYDRVIRHYQASAANCLKNFIFDHNTVMYSMSYHGFLSLGTVDNTGTGTLQITNNLLIDHFALGADTAYVRQVEFSDPGEFDPTNGLPQMAWVMTNPNSTAVWNIQKNYFATTDSGAAIFQLGPPNDNDYAGPFYHNSHHNGHYLTWGMNSVLNTQSKDTLNTFTPVTIKLDTSWGGVRQPGLMTELLRWVLNKSLDNKFKPTLATSSIWNWSIDFHRRAIEYYSDTLSCDYSSTTDLGTAGTDGQVIGDTRWSFTLIAAVGFSATPSTINFDSVAVGLNKADSVIVTNSGTTAALVIDSVKSSSAEFTVSPTTASIAVGASQKFTVTFAPASVGDKTGTIAFYSNAASSPDNVTVNGTGKQATGVGDVAQSLPKVYQLRNNYPNPFNPSTMISYDLPNQSRVVLKVYSLLGQEVATLVDGVQEAGYYHTTWNAQQNAGKSLASGVYLFRISAQSTAKAGQAFVQVKKMLLIK